MTITDELAEGVAESQAMNERLTAMGEAAAAAYWTEGAAEVPIEDLTIPGGAGQPQAARIYRGGQGGTLLYIHGGGWVGGSIAANERSARALAAQSGWNVLAISYRLAPEHIFPAAYDDTRAALAWLRGNGASYQLDTGHIALGGASAGANLALAAALAEPPGSLAGLLLFYGVFSDNFDSESCRRYATGYGFSLPRLREIFDLYNPDAVHRDDPRLCPLKGDLAGLPPATLIAAECDVLADDSRALHAALPGSTLHIEPGVPHGFINRGRLIPAAETCLTRAAQALTERAP